MHLALTVLAGVVAGFVNTLSGGGSYVVLPMLLGLGLDSHAANATNRVGVLVQNMVGIATFAREKKMPTNGAARLIVPSLLGAVVGAAIAVEIDHRTLDFVLGSLMLVMFGLVVAKPERFLRVSSTHHPITARSWILLFLVGVYGGFIQAGVGIFLLALLVLELGFDLVSANAAKLLLVLLMTAPALLIFAFVNQVVWSVGLLLAVGQSVGAFVAARFASRKQDAEIWIRRLLLIVLPATTIKLWFFTH